MPSPESLRCQRALGVAAHKDGALEWELHPPPYCGAAAEPTLLFSAESVRSVLLDGVELLFKQVVCYVHSPDLSPDAGYVAQALYYLTYRFR